MPNAPPTDYRRHASIYDLVICKRLFRSAEGQTARATGQVVAAGRLYVPQRQCLLPLRAVRMSPLRGLRYLRCPSSFGQAQFGY